MRPDQTRPRPSPTTPAVPAVLQRERGTWKHAGCGGLLIVNGHWTFCPKCRATLPTARIEEKPAPSPRRPARPGRAGLR